ncbi:MAG: aminodeoxychorismate synthase component I [Pedobacter sp.]
MTAGTTPQHPTALLESFSSGQYTRSFRFEGLETVIAAYSPHEVLPALAQIEQAVEKGRHAVGFVSYEAATALNPELSVMKPGKLPLLWFSIFAKRLACEACVGKNETSDCQVSLPELAIEHTAYIDAVNNIREAIAAGESYQVNFTTRQRFTVSGDPFTLYRRMCRNQQAPFCAWLDIGTHRILSASPELFFSLENDLLTMKPMKGTAARRPRADDDRHQRDLLAVIAKERAENLMIVDLVRNDLAIIAETGTVATPSLFDVETFPTIHQMTSTVTARIRPKAGLTDIFRALFPCGSVTGAPKRRTMEIIKGLEAAPRGLYCGAIGYLSPGREAVFSVAIRTAIVESASGNAEIGIGSGITWDSDAESEFQECLAKSVFMGHDSSPFQLIESLRHDGEGYLLLDQHLQRLSASATYFGFRFDNNTLRKQLVQLEQSLSGIHKVRIVLDPNGTATLAAQPVIALDPSASYAMLALSPERVTSSDPFLYHKTTRRALYDRELQAHPDCYDVIFLNERNELTEGSFNTIIVSLHGELLTPALDCGLLPGVLREELIEFGAVRETVLILDDLYKADKIWLVNSVRGWRECKFHTPFEKGSQGDFDSVPSKINPPSIPI